MKYPFAGVDPFIEWDNWPGFHLLFCGELIRQLNQRLPAGFVCRGEVNFGLSVDHADLDVRPDAAVQSSISSPPSESELDTGSYSPATTSAVLDSTDTQHRHLKITEQASGRIVAVVEVLSPSNKIGGGLIRYLRKRKHYLHAGLNLLKIDVVRQGRRHYEELLDYPNTPYAVFTYDATKTLCRIWSLALTDTLPIVPLRLTPAKEIAVDVQAAAVAAWEAGGYAQTFGSYDKDQLADVLSEEERVWLTGVVDGSVG